MRCYFLRNGHITGVEVVSGLSDSEAVEKFHALFESKKEAAGYEGFEVWEQARIVHQHPPLKDGSRAQYERKSSTFTLWPGAPQPPGLTETS